MTTAVSTMSKSAALARAKQLREALLDHGVRKVSIELQQGRPGTPNGRWYDTRFVAEMSHHTATYPSQGDTPALGLVKRGRSDVPGPLCNGYMGYDLVYRIICMGWANHPGAGGSLTVAGYRIPYNTGRPYFWGTEFEGGYVDWPDAMHEAMARSNAGILDWLGRPLGAHVEHKTWAPTRKIDRRGYTATSGRNRIKPFMGGGGKPTPPPKPKEWDEMASRAEVRAEAKAGALEALASDKGRGSIANGVAHAFSKGPTLEENFIRLIAAAMSDPTVRKLGMEIGSATARDARVFRREVSQMLEVANEQQLTQIKPVLDAIMETVDELEAGE